MRAAFQNLEENSAARCLSPWQTIRVPAAPSKCTQTPSLRLVAAAIGDGSSSSVM